MDRTLSDTDREAYEEIWIGKGMAAKYRDKFNDGYNVTILQPEVVQCCRFIEVKKDRSNGVLAAFEDDHPQVTNWDYRLAAFVTVVSWNTGNTRMEWSWESS